MALFLKKMEILSASKSHCHSRLSKPILKILPIYRKNILWRQLSQAICRKTSMQESLFLIRFHAYMLKEDSAQVFSCECSHIFQNAFVAKHLWVTASAKYPLLRRLQPQKMFSSNLFVLNIFEVNTVNCLRTALCGGPRQSAVTKLIYC